MRGTPYWPLWMPRATARRLLGRRVMKKSEAPARYYKLRLRTRADLARAFEEVMACPHVECCVVEESTRTLSFTAPSKFAALIMEREQTDPELMVDEPS